MTFFDQINQSDLQLITSVRLIALSMEFIGFSHYVNLHLGKIKVYIKNVNLTLYNKKCFNNKIYQTYIFYFSNLQYF